MSLFLIKCHTVGELNGSDKRSENQFVTQSALLFIIFAATDGFKVKMHDNSYFHQHR